MNRRVPRSFVVFLSLSGAAVAQQAAPPEHQLPPPRRFEVHRATSAVKVDGVLDEQAWTDALVYDLPYEWAPGDNTPPPVKTDFLVTYDDEHLYAAWRAYDPEPSQIRAHLMDRDAINTFVQDDHVSLMVDPFNDERRGFQFRINPLGVQADAIFSQNELLEDFSYDMIWDSAARITDQGYVVEIAVPLDQIRFPDTPGAQTWGFDVGRSYPRNVRHRIGAAPLPRGSNCVLCQSVKVSGFEDIEPGRNLELTPTVTARRTDRLDAFPDGGLETGDEETDLGLSARWGLTPNLTLSAAVNPDFSQVEADVAQLDVNERFALFFPEKRPFFLEGIDFFSTPIDAVFTRTVADPDWGVKLTGKEGRNAFGIFAAEDQVNSFLIPSNQGTGFGFLDQTVRSGVVRYRRDVGQNSTLGALVTAREGDDYHNRVYGADAFVRFDPTNVLRAQYLRSDSRYPGADAFDDDAFLVGYDHSGRDWYWSVAYEDRGPGFRADYGFVPRVDLREGRANLQRQLYGERGSWWTQINLGTYLQRTEDHSGRLTDERIDLYGNVSGPRQSFLEVSLEHNQQFVRGGRHPQGVLYEGLDRGQAFFRIQPSRVAQVTIFADLGETVDFNNNQPADLFQVAPGVELKLGRHVNAKLDHALQRLDVEKGELFEANLTQLRLIYNFSVRAFVRGIFQYLDLESDPSLFLFEIPAEQEELFTQLLFSYKLNPQTVLFLGYSDNQLGFTEIDLTRTDRTFFFKVGYAWLQ